ncbi:hypothetical protein J1N35_044038 [Gossypium stocksii]|uniref:Uncharacterized protein n=1 Tax=Gossypium stocksii TaxID=47602 RepID=A0A9D3ZFI7_9ROSI|nr:hypothetical protein J1N35_044038 [Gossypium stocksii]
MLEESMSSWQATMSSMSNTLEQSLKVIHCVMNTPMEEFENDIPELENEGHSTIIEHDELNIRGGDRDKIMRNEDSVFTLIDIGVGVGVGVELNAKVELNLELGESVEEPTQFF